LLKFRVSDGVEGGAEDGALGLVEQGVDAWSLRFVRDVQRALEGLPEVLASGEPLYLNRRDPVEVLAAEGGVLLLLASFSSLR